MARFVSIGLTSAGLVVALVGAATDAKAQAAGGTRAEPAPVDMGTMMGDKPGQQGAIAQPAPTGGDKYGAVIAEPAPVLGDPKYGDIQIVNEGGVSGASPDAYATPSPYGSGSGASVDLPVVGKVQLNWGGHILGGVHYRVEDRSTGPIWDRARLSPGFSRYETSLNLKLEATLGSFRGVADVDVDWVGFGDQTSGSFRDLLRREALHPVRFKAHALYLQADDLLLPGLDLRLGQQLVQWGVGDQFNPTNNLNSQDLENVLLFGQQIANLMARLDYNFLERWSVSAVLVPIFAPAVLPSSATVGITAVDRIPFASEHTRLALHAQREYFRQKGTATVVSDVSTKLPQFTAENMQWELRLAGTVFEQDIALSYYYGRSDIPQPIANHSAQILTPGCGIANNEACPINLLGNQVTLAFPKMQVVGLNLTGELPVIEVGYRFELGVYIPQKRRARLSNDDIVVCLENNPYNCVGGGGGTLPYPGGEYDYNGLTPDAGRPILIEETPFAKWTLGLDYTIGRYVMLNAMWVHGMPDEFGAGDYFHSGVAVREGGVTEDAPTEACALNREGETCVYEISRPKLGDFLVFGLDVKLDDQRLLLRLFTIFELSGYERRAWDETAQARVTQSWSLFSEEGFSAVIYPEVSYNFGNGFVLDGGALIQLGKRYTKFGDPAAGGSLVFLNGRYDF